MDSVIRAFLVLCARATILLTQWITVQRTTPCIPAGWFAVILLPTQDLTPDYTRPLVTLSFMPRYDTYLPQRLFC